MRGMTLKLAHVCLGSPDLERSRAFYCDLLGLKRKFDFIRDGELFGFYLELSDTTFLEIFRGEVAKVEDFPLRHFCLETDDLDAVSASADGRRLPPDGEEAGGRSELADLGGKSGGSAF